MTIKVKANLWSGIVSIIWALTLWFILIPNFIVMKRVPTSVAQNPQYMPRFIAIITFVLGVVLIVESLLFNKEKIVTLVIQDELRALGYCAILVVFAILIKRIGFLASASMLCVGTLLYLKSKTWYFYAIGLTVTFSIYFVFKNYLGILLP